MASSTQPKLAKPFASMKVDQVDKMVQVAKADLVVTVDPEDNKDHNPKS